MSNLYVSNSVGDMDVAVIGLSGRFPGAQDSAAFWQNLCKGVESISFFSDDELAAAGVTPAVRENPDYVNAGGVLSDIELFDAFFFGYSPNEAATMDPQHRLFLECAWEALEDAGYDPETYPGLIGVYAGAGMNTYLHHNLYPNRAPLEPAGDYHLMIASDKDFLATKVCYKLNLKGPGISVQTACSTSLVAVHLACQSLRSGECDIALAGGVSVRVPHRVGYLYREGVILSPDGHCRAFDAQAGGTVIGNGAGVVVLKMLSDALADGDRVLAAIKGSTINNDGSLKAGYTAPSLQAQAAVISEALDIAGIAPESVTYVEAHGTGTAIGDPIEVAALTKAFRRSTDEMGFCALGSVKTNIGHLDAAAGVVGLIKAVLMLEHKLIPPSLHFQEPNPRIDLANSPFYVNAALADWRTDRLPRRAGVSSFGIGGTNAHAALEEAPVIEPSGEAGPWQLLVLSTRTRSALDVATANLAKHLEQRPHINLADVAYTLQGGRRRFTHRRFLVCQDPGDAASALGSQDPRRVFTRFEEATEQPVVFMFTGQGAQYVDMALELYQVEPTFRKEIDRCSELLKPHLGLDLRDLLYPSAEQAEEAAQQLRQTSITQPALFVIEYALAKLWMAWGVQPAAMIGHSIGEYVAACLAGVFSLEDALALVAARGRLMQQLPAGAMLAVPQPEREVRPLLGTELSLAVINGPALCVVSGATEDVEVLHSQLAARGIACRRLQTSHAFHSAMMEPILEPFSAEVSKIERNPPQIPYVSNVSGTWITAAEANDPGYWARHLRQTVRFADGLQQLFDNPDQILLEVGPGRTLTTLATQHPGRAAQQLVLSSVRHPHDRQSDVAFLLTTLGKLWLGGAKVDWPGFHANERRLRLPLPTYPFERQRYWIDPPLATEPGLAATGQQPEKPSTARKQDVAEWFYVPSWMRSVVSAQEPAGQAPQSCWLVFVDECGLGSQLVKRLERAGQQVIVVQTGLAFKSHDGDYALNPGRKEDYDSLLADLSARGKKPRTIVHLWNVTPQEATTPGVDALDRTQDLGFYSLLFLAQALGKQNFTDDLDLAIVSTELQKVIGEEVLCPAKATVLGPVRILAHEYPNIRCRSIDVALPPAGADPDRKLVDSLLIEIAAKSPDSIVAYRGNHRWKQTFEPVQLDPPGQPAPKLRAGGVYLITGGLGGMGLTLAKHLAEMVQPKLILIGHSEFPIAGEWDRWLSTHGEHDTISRKIQQLRLIEELGAELLIIQADVARREQMQAAITQALARFGQIHGVIHTAGVPGDGMIQLKTRQVAQSVLAPKVQGTLILEDLLQDRSLDFFVLCSSHNSIIGRPGQVDYAAANAFLDAFVHQNRLDSAFTICINWDTWRQVGMAARAAEQWAGTRRPARPQSKTASHPLLDQCIAQSEAGDVYSTRFRVSEQWVLHEHGIMGQATLPGTTYLEMVRAAFASRAGTEVVEIRDVHFLTPLLVQEDEEKEVRTILEKQNNAFSFSVLSKVDPGGEGWQEHARGTIASLDVAQPRRREIGELENRCAQETIMYPLREARLGKFDLQHRTVRRGVSPQGEPLSVPSFVVSEAGAEAEGRVMEFGPRWNTLQWVKLGAEEGLALLELPEEFGADLQSYELHPALLDLATSFLRLFKSQGSYLPLSYKKLRIHGSLPGRIYSYARFAEHDPAQEMTHSLDITILDEQGRPLVEIVEFVVIRVQDASKLGAPSGLRPTPLLLSAGDPGLLAESTLATNLFQRDLQEGLLPGEAVDVFDRILSSTLSQVVVSTRDFLARIEESQALRASPLFKSAEDLTSPRPKHPRPDLMNAYAPPRNETEQKLGEIWQDVLGIAQVGVHDNFFDLGGDSLLIAQVHSRFRQSFDNDVSVATLLQYPTIAELAQFLSEQATGDQPAFEQVHERVSKQKEALRRRKQKMKKRNMA
jgi:acyl transferase domain-containing protein/aryl carrier-like protein